MKRHHNIQDKIIAEIEELEALVHEKEEEYSIYDSEFQEQSAIWAEVEQE